MEPTCTTTQEAEMTTLEILKQTREQYYTMTLKAGEKYLKALALKGEILPWAKGRVANGNYAVNIHVLNAEIESLEAAAETPRTSAPLQHCRKCGAPMTAIGKCDECDDWDY